MTVELFSILCTYPAGLSLCLEAGVVEALDELGALPGEEMTNLRSDAAGALRDVFSNPKP